MENWKKYIYNLSLNIVKYFLHTKHTVKFGTAHCF